MYEVYISIAFFGLAAVILYFIDMLSDRDIKIKSLEEANRKANNSVKCTVVKYEIPPLRWSYGWGIDPRRRWVNIRQMDKQELLLSERIEREEIAEAIGGQIKDYFVQAILSGDHPAIELIETPSKLLRSPGDPYTIEAVVTILPKIKT